MAINIVKDKRFLFGLTAFIFIMLLAVLTQAAIVTWTGYGSDSLASTSANWNTVPQSGDDVILDNSAKDCIWDLSLSLSSLTANTGYSGTITLNADLSISGDVNISGGSLILNNGNLLTEAVPLTEITGYVTDVSTGSLLSNASIIIVDALNQIYTTTTDSNGMYRISGLSQGNFTATFMKAAYVDQILNGISTFGQTLTLDVQLNPYALSFEIIRPTDAYNPEGWTDPSSGYDDDTNAYSYKDTPNSIPSISFGGSSSNETVNEWQNKSKYWCEASLYITFERQNPVNDLVEIVVTDQNGNIKHTILSTTSEVWPKKQFIQKLNMSDWGDGFNNIANLRVRVNGLKVQGSDHAESRVYDVRIEGGTSSVVKDYTRGAYSVLPNSDSNLATTYTPVEVGSADLDDGIRVSQDGSSAQFLMHQFKRKTPSHNMVIAWDGQINQAVAEAFAQSFEPNVSGNVTAVRIFFKKAGSPNGSLRVRIKSELGSNIIAESNVISETSLVTGGSWKTFTFSNPAIVSAGNTYYIEIWRNKADALNYPRLILKDCSNFTNLDNFYWWRRNGGWAMGSHGAVLFETDINNSLDVSTASCYSLSTPERNLTGLDWGNIYLEAYNRTTSSWVQLDTALYDGSTTDINLLGTVVSDDYFDENDWISARVYTIASNILTYLATDLLDFTLTPLPAFLTGTLTDLSTGLPVSDVTISVTDSNNDVYTSSSNSDGIYSVSGLSPGDFLATFDKTGYIEQSVSGTLAMNESKTVDVQLPPIPPLTLTITSPMDGALLTSSPIAVMGNVSNSANVTINGVQAIVNNGTFSASIPLSGGQNTITAFAADSYSQTSTQSINVTFITPPVISDIMVSDINTDSATITWTTDQQSDSLVEYGTTTSYDNSSSDASITTNHSITLTGLTPATEYHFKITSASNYGVSSSSGDNMFATFTPPPPVISDVFAVNITSDSATITWTTDQQGDSIVDYGTTTVYGSSVSDPVLTVSHSITLSGLNPGTTYHFKVTSTNTYGVSSSTGDNTFTTIIPSPPVISNIVVSNITDSSATITWTTDQSADSLVDYGTTTLYGSTASDPTLTTNHSMILSNLGMGVTYHFRVTSTNGYSLTSFSGDDIFNTTGPITITIISPLDNATISRADSMVTGTITNSTGNETGVTVNGMVATVYNGQFFTNHVPLQDGQNTIMANAVDTEGNTASNSILVDANTTTPYIFLRANIESGIALLTTYFSVSTEIPNAVSTYQIDYEGDAVIDYAGTNFEDISFIYSTEGIYYPTVTVTDNQSNNYTDTIAIIVLNQNDLDMLLRTKWQGMKTALVAGDTATALNYISPITRTAYQEMFSALTGQLASIIATQTGFNLITIKDNIAQYKLNTLESGTIYSYKVIFSKDSEGIWMIQDF